jgi:hypothetical protein
VLLLLSGFTAVSSTSRAIELGGGLSVVEEGDDRFRPALSLYGSNSFYFARAFYYGRSFGPVTENTILISVSRKMGLFRSKQFYAGLGFSLIQETTTVAYEASEDQGYNISDSKVNGGLFAGIYWQPLVGGNLTFNLGWESSLFPAGIGGGLFLSTGRKQNISSFVGMKF